MVSMDQINTILPTKFVDIAKEYIDESKLDDENGGYMKKHFDNSEFIAETVMPLLYQAEMNVLKQEEPIQHLVQQKVNEFEAMISQSEKKVRLIYLKAMGQEIPESEIFNDEPLDVKPAVAPNLATTEGWLNYKYQLGECMFRCSASLEQQPRYFNKNDLDKKFEEYKTLHAASLKQ